MTVNREIVVMTPRWLGKSFISRMFCRFGLHDENWYLEADPPIPIPVRWQYRARTGRRIVRICGRCGALS